ncbi:MAG: hypothetical protein R3E01_22870 [Pirellulaceae bacterium]|nr:hypothetical protein [Planctomycetales bacterium]
MRATNLVATIVSLMGALCLHSASLGEDGAAVAGSQRVEIQLMQLESTPDVFAQAGLSTESTADEMWKFAAKGVPANGRSMTTQVQLVALDGGSSMIQVGQTVPVAVGRTMSAARGFGGAGGRGGAAPLAATQFNMQNIGTLVRAEPRVDGDQIIVKLSFEQSRLAATPTADEAADPTEDFAPQRTLSQTVETTVRVDNGGIALVSGLEQVATDEQVRSVLLVSAKIMDK